MIVPILIITVIGLVAGIAIYMAFLGIPQKVKGLEKTEEITGILPGRNCAACGYPGCFGFAQALTANPELIRTKSCALAAQEADRIQRLGAVLGIELDPASMLKRAFVKCGSNSPDVYSYSGAMSCKAAAQLLGGYKKCPYACLGFGDCVNVCPQNAISIDPEKKIAVVDWSKCVGCGLCVTECPKGIIEIVEASTKIGFRCSYEGLRDIPEREKCDFGCTHCRKCFQACEYQAIIWDKTKAVPQFDFTKCTLCMKCVEACEQHVLISTVKVEKKEPVAA